MENFLSKNSRNAGFLLLLTFSIIYLNIRKLIQEGAWAMNIYKFADLIDQELVITRFPNQKNRFICLFEHAETRTSKDDRILSSDYGEGRSPQAAIKSYVREIRGKLLIINATSSERKEFQVPEDLRAFL